MKMAQRLLILHIAGCLAFLAIPLFLTPGPGMPGFRLSDHVLRDLSAYGLMILLFYTNFFFLIPRLYFRRKYLYFAASNLLALAAITAVPLLIFPHHPEHFTTGPGGRGGSWLFEIGHNLLLFLVVLFVSLTIRINNQWRRTEREKLSAELAFLKAQINPHFLFNTLNSIYALAIERSARTAEAIAQLGTMMRYATMEADRDLISLDREIAYISDYIDLQRLRLGDTVQLSYRIEGEPGSGAKIAPLILIPLVENAFKHGVNPEEASSIDIGIQLSHETLVLRVQNNKVTAPAEQVPGGLGLPGLRQRLQLLYPSRHRLAIDDHETSFSATLHITLV